MPLLNVNDSALVDRTWSLLAAEVRVVVTEL